MSPHLGGFVDVCVGDRAQMEGLDDPFGWGGVHNGTAHNLGHVAVIIGQIDLHNIAIIISSFAPILTDDGFKIRQGQVIGDTPARLQHWMGSCPHLCWEPMKPKKNSTHFAVNQSLRGSML